MPPLRHEDQNRSAGLKRGTTKAKANSKTPVIDQCGLQVEPAPEAGHLKTKNGHGMPYPYGKKPDISCGYA